MKKICFVFVCLGLLFSCKDKDECITCSSAPASWSDGEHIVTIPNVFTPNNFDICDSMVFSPITQTYMEPAFTYTYLKTVCTEAQRNETPELCPCVENPDAQYNDSKNNVLKIQGIENFENNTFTLLKNGDIVLKIEDYDNDSRNFNGYIIDTTGEHAKGKHLTGTYDVRLCLYGNEAKSEPLTTMNGTVTIIRTKQSCEATDCVGYDSDDPLLVE